MSENKEKEKDRNKDKTKDKDKDKSKEIDRTKCNSSSSFTTIAAIASRLTSPTTDCAKTISNSNTNLNNGSKFGEKIRKSHSNLKVAISDEFLLKPPTTPQYKTSISSLESEVFALDLETGDLEKLRQFSKDDAATATVGTQRVYKKTSPNSILTMYLPTREIISCGTQTSILKGILFVDPNSIQGYRVYAQLTLTFRYGREDEEVMGLRFCNEAIMSLYQIYPRTEDPKRDSLTPLQDALIKRLGLGAFPFTLSLSSQSPPSVQLVPAKRYYGAPIGTSYDVRCFIADKTDDKFHRKATVKMGVRVIHKTDVFSTQQNLDPNNPLSPPPPISPTILKNTAGTGTNISINTINSTTSDIQITNQSRKSTDPITIPTTQQSSSSNTQQCGSAGNETHQHHHHHHHHHHHQNPSNINSSDISNNSNSNTLEKGNNLTVGGVSNVDNSQQQQKNLQQLQPVIQPQSNLTTAIKSKKQERVDSFPKIRLSPKSFRFSGRFGRSKSEVERGSSDPFYNYSKSFHEVSDFSKNLDTCGPQGAVDKPFLLQEGRVCLRASLNKSWYTHGEHVIVTVNIKNDSRKTVRKIRVCAIQHVDVCMFNNGKFKNVVADSDNNNLPSDQTTVGPGKTLCTKINLKPKRGPTKNWIALEDSLQRCSEPDEITGDIAASAVRMPTINPIGTTTTSPVLQDDRNVFAIYVSYYVKVKLTLSGMGGELSLKLPFSLVHIDSSSLESHKIGLTISTKGNDPNQLNSPNKLKQQNEKPVLIIKANSTGTTTNNSNIGGQTSKEKTSAFSRQAKGHASDDDIIDIDEDYNSIRPDTSTACSESCNNNGKGGGCSSDCSNSICTSGGIHGDNKQLHSLERIDSIEDEIPIQIPSIKNLQKRRLTRSDIRVEDDEDDEKNIIKTTVTTTTSAITTTTSSTTTIIADAIVHRTMKISSDQIEIHHSQHSHETDTISSPDNIINNTNSIKAEINRCPRPHAVVDNIEDENSLNKINEKENFNRFLVSDNDSSGNQCDNKKITIQQILLQSDDNNVPQNDEDVTDVVGKKSEISAEQNNAISSSTTTIETSTTGTIAHNTNNNDSSNSDNNQNNNQHQEQQQQQQSQQQHNIQTTCAQIHKPYDF